MPYVPAALTYPGAQALVDYVLADLQRRYPAVPDELRFADEPAGDFGVAHFYNFFHETDLVTFDSGRIPTLYVICHEIGHAIDANVCERRGGNGFTNGLYDEFWAARGFPDTPHYWQQFAESLNTPQNPNGGYGYYPMENFADAFGAVNSYGAGTLITAQHGAYLDEPRMRAFYASLEGADMALTEQDYEEIARRVSLKILPEILTKLDSGFNNTLPILLNRQTAGDKDVRTAEKE